MISVKNDHIWQFLEFNLKKINNENGLVAKTTGIRHFELKTFYFGQNGHNLSFLDKKNAVKSFSSSIISDSRDPNDSY